MRYKALDSWRGLCALGVALFHFPLADGPRLFPLFADGGIYVDFFFLLSGFVITKAWGARVAQPGQLRVFLIRRFGRIWPLHAACLALFVGISLLQRDIGSDIRHDPRAILTNLLMIHAWGLHAGLTWNAPSWSISVEAALYLVFAMVTRLKLHLVLYAVLIAVGVAVVAFVAPEGMSSTYDFGVFRGLSGFFAGALLAHVPARDLRWPAQAATMLVALVFIGLREWTLLAPLVFGAVVYVYAYSSGPIGALLERSAFVRLGDWSYSIYLLHAAVGGVIWALAPILDLKPAGEVLISPSPVLTALLAVAYVVVLIAAAAVSYRFLESPAREWFNALSRRKSAPAQV